MQPQPYGYPPPQRPQPRKSNALVVILAIFAGLFGSCLSVCGYYAIKAQTPAGKRAAKEEHDRQRAALEAYVAKLGRIRDASTDASAAAGCKVMRFPHDAPRVDSYYLAALIDGDASNLAASKLLRGSPFSQSILDAWTVEHGGDAGAFSSFALGQGSVDVAALDREPVVLFLRVDAMTAPSVSGSSFVGGSVHGVASAVDWKTEKPLCSARLDVESSDEVSYGGGTKIKVHGIPVGTVGKKDLEEAVAKDFKKNLESALDAAFSK